MFQKSRLEKFFSIFLEFSLIAVCYSISLNRKSLFRENRTLGGGELIGSCDSFINPVASDNYALNSATLTRTIVDTDAGLRLNKIEVLFVFEVIII